MFDEIIGRALEAAGNVQRAVHELEGARALLKELCAQASDVVVAKEDEAAKREAIGKLRVQVTDVELALISLGAIARHSLDGQLALLEARRAGRDVHHSVDHVATSAQDDNPTYRNAMQDAGRGGQLR